MEFERDVYIGKILKRYKRFFADVELDNAETIVAHTPNTGSMKGCWEAGWKSLVTHHDNPKRKLQYTLEMTHNGKSWIGVNTARTNALAREAIENGTILELQNYNSLQSEKKVGKSRIDFFLEFPDTECYIEVKNVTMASNGIGTKLTQKETADFKDYSLAIFPDSVTTRGQKHLNDLIELKKQGIRACMLYIIQREDVSAFTPASEIDSEYARLLKHAKEVGVEILAYRCELKENAIQVTTKLPVIL